MNTNSSLHRSIPFRCILVIGTLLSVLILPVSFGMLANPNVTTQQRPLDAQGSMTTKASVLGSLSPNFTSENSLELGYSPGSLAPITTQIPIYTVNDQLWIESNLNSSASVSLTGQQGQTLASSDISPKTALSLYTFDSDLQTSILTLTIGQYSVPIEFVNPFSSPSYQLSSVTTGYSITNATLFTSISFDSSNIFNIQQCLTNSSTSNQAEVALPSSIGSGYVGVTENPADGSAELSVENATANPFTFSFELLANYSYSLIGSSGISYSQIQVESSRSVFVGQTGPGFAPIDMTFSNLIGLRAGRYVLRAFFENALGVFLAETPLFIGSSSSSSWFWLGSCQELGPMTSDPLTVRTSLAGPPSSWPRYLYLMYQVDLGIDSFTNVSLGPGIDRIRFVVAGSDQALPSDIGIITVSADASIKDLDVQNNGVIYLLSSQYPSSIQFALSFAGKTFDTQTVDLGSQNLDNIEQVKLGLVSVSVKSGNKSVPGAIVDVIANNLDNATYDATTGANGTVQVDAPSGNYTVVVKDEGNTTTKQFFLDAGATQSVQVTLPPSTSANTSGNNHETELILVASVVTVLGVAGNLWFWFAKRWLRRSKKSGQP